MPEDEVLSDRRIAELTPDLDQAYVSLAEESRSGDERACEQMIATCRDYLLFIANQELDPQLQAKCGASDIVQDAMAQAVANYDGFRGDSKRELLGWLRRILLNELGGVRRRYLHAARRDVRREVLQSRVPNTRAEHLEPVDLGHTPATEAAQQEDARRLRAALVTLSASHQQVLRLRNWERLTFAQIGETMNRSEDAVKKLWARALANLKQTLDEGTAGDRE